MVMTKSSVLPVLGALLLLSAGMAGAATLTGRVVDSQGQRSYAGAGISAGTAASASSDGQGFFRIEDVAAGPLLLAVELPDGEQFRVRLQVPARPALFVELDRARHVAPADDDEY